MINPMINDFTHAIYSKFRGELHKPIPPELVDDMISHITPNQTVATIDAGCIVALKLLAKGHRCDKITILDTLIPDDYYLNFNKSIANRFSFHHNPKNMKFDVIIGNPPYNVDNNPSYYVKFITKAKELLKEGGHLNLIIPNRFLDPGSTAGKALSDLNMIEINANVNHHFPSVATQIAAFHATKGEANSQCKMIFDVEDKVIDWDYTKPMPIQTTSYLSAMIVDKVFSYPGDKLVASKQPTGDNYLFIDSAYERYHHLKEKGGEKTPISRINMNNTGIIKNGSGNYYHMDSVEQAELNAWFVSRSMLGRFCSLCFANSAQVNFRNIARMSRLSDIAMNDDVLYNMFNLTAEEVEHLEAIMNSTKNIT